MQITSHLSPIPRHTTTYRPLTVAVALNSSALILPRAESIHFHQNGVTDGVLESTVLESKLSKTTSRSKRSLPHTRRSKTRNLTDNLQLDITQSRAPTPKAAPIPSRLSTPNPLIHPRPQMHPNLPITQSPAVTSLALAGLTVKINDQRCILATLRAPWWARLTSAKSTTPTPPGKG